jgi:hypothetical protein
VQVVAVALEQVVAPDADLDEQVARRAAVAARLAVAGRADAHAVVDAGRYLDLQRLLLLDLALAAATGAGFGDDLAAAVAVRAGLLHAEEALAHLHRAAAVAGAAGLGAGAGLGAAAVAGVTFLPARDADLAVLAVGGFLERDLHRVREVGAAVDLASAARATAAATAEDVAEDVAKGLREAAEALGATRAAAHVGVDPGVAVLVIGRALLRVAQHLVGFLDLLELFFGGLGGITLVAVRVVLHRQLAIRLLDFVVAGGLGHAQDFVKVSFGHDCSEHAC